MHFLSIESLGNLLTVVSIVVLAWFAWDMGSMIKASQRKNQLSIEGRWKDLESHFERASKSYRPFVWLHQRYLLPGNLTTQHALFLYSQGRHEEALAKVDQAIRQIEGKPQIFSSIFRQATFGTLCGSLHTRTLILVGLGRYDEARQVAAQSQNLTGPGGGPNAALAWLEFYSGRLDEALAQAQTAPPGDKLYGSMRNLAALAHSTKGEFDEAIQALMYEPSDISKFYSSKGLEVLSETPDGAKLIELQRRKLASVSQPARLLLLAHVYLDHEQIENAVQALDQAEKALGSEPAIQASYCRYRACSLAAQGKAGEAEIYIKRVRAITQQLSNRFRLWEMHFTAGRSYLYLGRFSDALAEYIKAQSFVLHPIEKHATSYWIARTHEAAGRQREAISYYQIVATDPIPSWMRQRAAEALARKES